MRYLGGKARISKPLSVFLNKQLYHGQPFVDLFCGSCNVISKIDGNRNRIANDKHPYLMAMWMALQNGWIPPTQVSKETFQYIKSNLDENPALSGFVGFGCSFAGMWGGGYATGANRNYALNAYNSIQKKLSTMEGISFYNDDYSHVPLPENALVYCDIPYKSTRKYSPALLGEFDHVAFNDWCRQKEKLNIPVFVSEYEHNCPEDATIVWSMKSKQDVRNKTGVKKQTTEIVYRFL